MGRFNEYPRVSLYECRCVNCGWTSLEVFKNRLDEKESQRRDRNGGRMVVSLAVSSRLRGRGGLGWLCRVNRRKVGGNDWKGVVRAVRKVSEARKPTKVCPAYKERRVSRERLAKVLADFGEVKRLRPVGVPA